METDASAKEHDSSLDKTKESSLNDCQTETNGIKDATTVPTSSKALRMVSNCTDDTSPPSKSNDNDIVTTSPKELSTNNDHSNTDEDKNRSIVNGAATTIEEEKKDNVDLVSEDGEILSHAHKNNNNNSEKDNASVSPQLEGLKSRKRRTSLRKLRQQRDQQQTPTTTSDTASTAPTTTKSADIEFLAASEKEAKRIAERNRKRNDNQDGKEDKEKTMASNNSNHSTPSSSSSSPSHKLSSARKKNGTQMIINSTIPKRKRNYTPPKEEEGAFKCMSCDKTFAAWKDCVQHMKICCPPPSSSSSSLPPTRSLASVDDLYDDLDGRFVPKIKQTDNVHDGRFVPKTKQTNNVHDDPLVPKIKQTDNVHDGRFVPKIKQTDNVNDDPFVPKIRQTNNVHDGRFVPKNKQTNNVIDGRFVPKNNSIASSLSGNKINQQHHHPPASLDNKKNTPTKNKNILKKNVNSPKMNNSEDNKKNKNSSRQNKNPELKCEKCNIFYTKFDAYYEHMEVCCPFLLTQNETDLYNKQLSESKWIPPSSPSSKIQSAPSSFSSTTAAMTTPQKHERETGQRRKSNLPAWMTRGLQQPSNNATTGTGVTSTPNSNDSKQPVVPSSSVPSAVEKTRSYPTNNNDITNQEHNQYPQQHQIKDTSRRKLSNLPAWMTQKAKTNATTNYTDGSSSLTNAATNASSSPPKPFSSSSPREKNESQKKKQTHTNYFDPTSNSRSVSPYTTTIPRHHTSSQPIVDTSRRRGVSNLPAWMTKDQKSNSNSNSSTIKNSQVDNTRVVNNFNSSSSSKRPGCFTNTNSSNFRSNDYSSANRRPSLSSDLTYHDTKRKSSRSPNPTEYGSYNNSNSNHRSHSKETSSRRGLSNLPAWMTKNDSSNNDRNELHANYHDHQNPKKRARFEPPNNSSTATHNQSSNSNSRNDTYYNHNSHTTMSLSSRQDKEIHQQNYRTANNKDAFPISNATRETSKRRGVSNLPAWMTRK